MEKIPYKLIRSRRKTLSMELRPEGLVVRAPLRATNGQIESFVEQHRQWIRQHQEKLERQKRQAAALPPLTGAELQYLTERARRYIPELVRYYAPGWGWTTAPSLSAARNPDGAAAPARGTSASIVS